MSFIECLRGQVRPSTFEELEDTYNVFRAAGMDDAKAALALQEWWSDSSVSFRHVRMASAIKQAEAEVRIADEFARLQGEWDKMNPFIAKTLDTMRIARRPTLADAQAQLLHQAELSAQSETRKVLGALSEVYKLAAPKGLMIDADRSAMREITTGLIDGADNIKDPTIKLASTQLRRAFDRMLDALREQGAQIGGLANYAPVKHNAAKMGPAGFDAWFPAYSAAVRVDEVIDFRTGKIATPERFREIAQNMFDDVTSGGATRVTRELNRYGREMKSRGSTDTFTRRMQGRIANFKDAESFHTYNDEFGVGAEGMFDLMVSALEGMGRDVGIMKVMGPMPRAHMDRLVSRAKSGGVDTEKSRILGDEIAKAKAANLDQKAVAKMEAEKAALDTKLTRFPEKGADAGEVAKLNGLYRTLTGSWNGSVNTILTQGVAAMQHGMSASLLGGAAISALSDIASIQSTKRLFGLVGGSGFSTALKAISGNADDALRAIHIAEAISHTNVSRYDGSEGLTPTGNTFVSGMNGIKNVNHRISGLQRITNATGDVITMAFFGDLGMYAQRGAQWGDLPDTFRGLLSRHNLNEQDFKQIVGYGVDDKGLITPDWLPDSMGGIADRLDNINTELRMFATNSPELKTRYWSSGNVFGEQVQGGGGHLAMSSLMQFKSFPVQIWRNHFVPSLIRMAQGDLSPLALLVAQSVFMGGIVVQLKETVKGNEFMSFDDPQFYLKTMWQAGFMGLVGDTLFKDPQGYRRNLIVELAGPVPTVTADLALTVMGSIANGFTAGEQVDTAALTRAMRPFVPFSSLWYTKTALDRIIMDTLNAALDDDYYETINRRRKTMQEERGGQGWWEQGEKLPEVMQ
jgi:hypothetical protein